MKVGGRGRKEKIRERPQGSKKKGKNWKAAGRGVVAESSIASGNEFGREG